MTFVDKILKEAAVTQHFIDRFNSRFLSSSTLNVGFESKPGQYTKVGTYELPSDIKSNIIKNIELVKKFNFPKNKDFGIKLGLVNIDKNKVDYIKPEYKDLAKKETLVFVDVDGSNGNVVFAVVRKNEFVTLYFGKSYVPQDANKLQVDFMIADLQKAIEKKSIR